MLSLFRPNLRVNIIALRVASQLADRPPEAKIQWKPPATEKGFFKYDRDWSRDTRYKPPPGGGGDTFVRFLFYKFFEMKELWPLWGLTFWSCALVVWIVCSSFNKIEIRVDRSQKHPPWDWSRARENYWKFQTQAYDPKGITHMRLPIMEKLQDQMLEAAKKRGTRE